MAENKYSGKPNVLRVAAELAGYKDSDKVLAALQVALKCGVDDPTDSENDIGLAVS